jgi:hypothetical protein
MKKILLAIILLTVVAKIKAQTMTDGLMMPTGSLCTGVLFGHDQWKKYWEGSLKRENANIGKFSANSAMWVANYGLLNKVNVIAMLPYVGTKVSGGTLRPMEGVQDITIAGKYHAYRKEFEKSKFSVFGVVAVSTPLSNYTPDFLPLSIGLATTNLSFRGITSYSLSSGFYLTATGAYTWRSNTYLDRSYFTDNKQHYTNEVWMPNVIDFSVNVGYHKGPIQVDASYMQQNTLGGGDIRRQDMPFASNKMNYSKAGLFVLYYLPVPKGLAVRAGTNYTVAGRNVGQAFSTSLGLLYTINFSKPE